MNRLLTATEMQSVGLITEENPTLAVINRSKAGEIKMYV